MKERQFDVVDKVPSRERELEKSSVSDQLLARSVQFKDDRKNLEEKSKNDQELIIRLRSQVDELTRTVLSLRLENQELRNVKRLDDERILKAELQERDTASMLR